MSSIDNNSGPPPVGALSLAGFCKLYNVGRTKCYDEISSGRLTARKLGRKTVILRSEAIRWANALPKLGAAE